MRPKRELGQHFLVAGSFVDRILETCAEEAPRAAAILEVGPGEGALTGGLLGLGRPVHAIELDTDLAVRLAGRHPGLVVSVGDARELDLPGLAVETRLEPWLVVGNLPYNVGTGILQKVLGSPGACCACVAMLQREVVEKFCAGAGGVGYGPLAAWAEAWWFRERLFSVPPGAFAPPPKVTSAVCRFRPKEVPLLPSGEAAPFLGFLRVAFQQRRKTLASNLRALPAAGEAHRWEEALEAEGLGPSVRPVEASPRALARLFGLFKGP